MSFYHTIERFALKHKLIEHNKKIVVGLSGGPDSVFLLYFLTSLQKKYDISLIAAHFNHQWRSEADSEQENCKILAHTLNIPFITAKRTELSVDLKHNGSQEEYGRKMRRYFFEKILHEQKADAIALAHHLQDQEETFFIRLIRGSGLAGLTAMKAKNGLYIRPLLETNKNDILSWLHTHNIPYTIDSTNESLSYLRNRIRLLALPALRKCDQRFEKKFLTTLNHLKETESFLERLTQKTFEEISFIENNQRYIHIFQLLSIDEVLRNRILLHWLIIENVTFPMTQAFFDEIIRFLHRPTDGQHFIHKEWSLLKRKKFISLIKK